MKVSIDKDLDGYIKHLQGKVDELARNALNNVVDYATNQAQNGYDKFVVEVPADDPFVFVSNTPITQSGNKMSRTINCVGNQVLFIEFGAGKYFYTGDTELRLYRNVMLDRRGNPIADKPKKIYDIGEYGSGRGKDDVWFYKSSTGRTGDKASSLVKYNSKGEPIMITHGNRPARALYRAVGMAMRRLIGGKFK